MVFRTFARGEDGAALVDWVVLMSALFALASGVFIAFGDSAETVGDAIETTLDEMTVGEVPTVE
ncbi:MAG: hypothetical protein VX874_20260 [Pseudomonadota bacterium]|nr:hypothetical protein [Pseudomonadota bacterium]